MVLYHNIAMKTVNAKTKSHEYLVQFVLKNKQTKIETNHEEIAYSFSKEDHAKISKDIENKYRGQGYKVSIKSILERS